MADRGFLRIAPAYLRQARVLTDSTISYTEAKWLAPAPLVLESASYESLRPARMQQVVLE